MPIVSHNNLPTFERLSDAGEWVVAPDIALPELPNLRIALINLMPDAALSATERQFCSLIARSVPLCNCFIYPVALAAKKRTGKAQEHVATHYQRWQDMRHVPLDLVIITGANITQPDISQEPFAQELLAVIDDIQARTLACLFSCLAAHLLLHAHHNQPRTPLAQKHWGLFMHKPVGMHFLTQGINSQLTVPHSRFNDVSAEQFLKAGFTPLIVSKEVGVHLAVSEDSRFLCMQGHPEYDAVSLIKEYKREIKRYVAGMRPDYPTTPKHYFSLQLQAICDEYQDALKQAKANANPLPEFPEDMMLQSVVCDWRDTACMIMGRWLHFVYRSTYLADS